MSSSTWANRAHLQIELVKSSNRNRKTFKLKYVVQPNFERVWSLKINYISVLNKLDLLNATEKSNFKKNIKKGGIMSVIYHHHSIS